MSELDVFAAALQIPGESQRSDYLNLVCKTDAALRQRIEALLRNHEGAGSFLSTPAGGHLPTELLASTPKPGVNDEDESVLDILKPSARPGALGRLGHYEVLEILGKGGFGTVVRAFDEKLHRIVAIKIMSSRLGATSPARKRFIREARSSAAIRHENVVAIHAIEEQPTPFLVMEFIAGETLQQKLDRTGPLDPADAVRIGVQIAHGLAAAHAMGKIHRDIKPANILLENGVDRVKITDFGLARAADDASLTQSGVIAGTPLYMAPEQAQSLEIDHRADLFSLGSVLYAICSGRPPFRAATTLAVLKRVAEDTPRPIRESVPEMPEGLCAIIARLHAKKPEHRFQSASEVADVLGKYLRQPASSDSFVEAKLVTARRRRSFAIPAAVLLFIALLGLGLIGLASITGLFRNSSSDSKQGVTVSPSTAALDKEPDRRGAEYALSIGGLISIIDRGVERVVYPGSVLTKEPFDLTVVNFNRNRDLTDAGMDNFKDCRRLAIIDIEKTRLTPAKILELKRALPWCRIDWDGDIALLPVTPDRLAAEYVLGKGGSISIKGGGIYRDVYTRRALPDGLFEIRAAYLSHLPNVNDADLAVFKNCQRLQAIGLSNTNVSDAGLVHFTECPALISVELSGTSVTNLALARLKDRLSLTALGLGGVAITDDGLASLRNCRNLTHFYVGDTPVSDVGLAHLADCKNLLRLILTRTQVSNAGLAYFKACAKLYQVDVGYTQVGDAGLAHLTECKNLALLMLEGTQVSDAGLAHLANWPKLTLVDLHRTQIGDAGVVHLRECKDLNDLNLADTQVSDAGVTSLAGLSRLYSLNIKNTKVTEAGVSTLAAALPGCRIEWDGGVTQPTSSADPDRRVAEWLRSPPGIGIHIFADDDERPLSGNFELPNKPFQLRRLMIHRHPKMSDDTLSVLKGLRHLTHLNIRHCNAGDAVFACFKDCKDLREVELHGTRVTDAGVAQLANFPKLQYVNLNQTAVTAAAVKKLAAALPKCKVEWNGGVLLGH